MVDPGCMSSDVKASERTILKSSRLHNDAYSHDRPDLW